MATETLSAPFPVGTRDILWTLLQLVGGSNVQILKCPFAPSTRDLLYTLVQNGITAGGGGGGGPIPDGSITTAKLANGAVTAAKIGTGAVTASKMAAASVSDIVSTTKTVGLGVGSDGQIQFDAKGRISSITEATP